MFKTHIALRLKNNHFFIIQYDISTKINNQLIMIGQTINKTRSKEEKTIFNPNSLLDFLQNEQSLRLFFIYWIQKANERKETIPEEFLIQLEEFKDQYNYVETQKPTNFKNLVNLDRMSNDENIYLNYKKEFQNYQEEENPKEKYVLHTIKNKQLPKTIQLVR